MQEKLSVKASHHVSGVFICGSRRQERANHRFNPPVELGIL